MPTLAEVLGLTGVVVPWKLQYGLPGKSGITEVQPKDIPAFKGVDPWYTVQGDWLRIRVLVNAGTTENSKYPRFEVRQMTGAGREAAWDSRTTDCWFEYELAVTRLPAKKPQMCVAQLHDERNDLLEVLYQRNSDGGYEFTLRVDGSSEGQKRVPHPLGTPCVLAMAVVKGMVTIYRDGQPILATAKMPQAAKTYAKLLNYLQSNTTKDAASEYGEMLARNIRLGAGVYPGPRNAPTAPSVPSTPAPVGLACPHCKKPVTVTLGTP